MAVLLYLLAELMDTRDSRRIDGSYGEGGGQIVRTALALSAITGAPLELVNIRKGRSRPGLGNQHLACVKALAQITHAQVDGASVGSMTLRFAPGAIHSGTFTFDVAEERGSAGSVTLMLQAILPVLLCSPKPSVLTLRGGTHVPFSPPVHYTQAVLLPMLHRLGVSARVELVRAGWYPKGGGEIRVTIDPWTKRNPASLETRGKLLRLSGWSLVSNLPESVARRQRDAMVRALEPLQVEAAIACQHLTSPGQGSCLVLVGQYEGTLAGWTALGARGKPAERVGKEVAEAFQAFHNREAALEPHLADQLCVYLANAPGESRITISQLSPHVLTNLWTIRQFLSVQETTAGSPDEPGRVTIVTGT